MQETYYVAPLDEGPSQKISKGKLVDKYRNLRKALRAAGFSRTQVAVETSTADSG